VIVPRAGVSIPADQAQQGGLARPVGADEPDHVSFGDGMTSQRNRLILGTWPGSFRSDSDAFWQSAAPRMAGNTYRLPARAVQDGQLPARE
jgi:hypothetical protein